MYVCMYVQGVKYIHKVTMYIFEVYVYGMLHHLTTPDLKFLLNTGCYIHVMIAKDLKFVLHTGYYIV
jgi:hypothetical protein